MFSPKFINQDRDDLVTTIFSELKILGVKIPKLKKFKTNVLKSEKPVQTLNCKIFGLNLSDQEWISNGEFLLPKFLAISTAYLERFSKNEIGLFRKAGNVARQKRLRVKLEEGGDLEDSEPNDVASLLKQWLRELPEPLISPCLQDLFLRCLSLEIKENCVTACLLICLLLSPEQLHTLKYLLNFMANIASNCDKNKMDSYNIALIMAPNIFVSQESPDKISNNLVKQHTSILKKLIENCDKIGEIPPGVTFQYPSVCSELDSSSDILDSNANKSKKKLKSGPVQEIFSGFKKFVGQNNTPLSKNATPESYLDSSAPKSVLKRKVEPEQYLSAVKRQAVSKDDLENQELGVTPKRNGLVNKREKSARSHVRRKSIGALLRRKDKKSGKSTKLPAKELELEFQPSLSIATTKNPDVNVFYRNASPNAIKNSETKIINRSSSIKKSWSDCPLPLLGTEFSMLPVITIQSSEGCLSNLPSDPSLFNSNSENLLSNNNLLEKDTRRNYSESKMQKYEFKEISKEEMLPSSIVNSASSIVEIDCGRNEIINLDTRIKDYTIHPKSVRRSPRISASAKFSSADTNAKLLEENNLDKENVRSERLTSQKNGLPRQEAFIKKNPKQKSKNLSSELENLNIETKGLSNKKKNSLNYSLIEDNTKEKNINASGRKSLRRKTRHGSLIRGQPNSVKSGLRLTVPRHCTNSSFLLNSPNVDSLRYDATFINNESYFTESPTLRSLDLSLSSLLHNFCLNSPKDLPEFSFDVGTSPNKNESAVKLNIYRSNSEEIKQSPKILKISEKTTPPLKRPKRLSSKSDSKLQKKKILSELKRSDSYTGKQSEFNKKNSRNNSVSPKVNKALSPVYIEEKNSIFTHSPVINADSPIFTQNFPIISTISPIITAQNQEFDRSLFKTPNNKCNGPDSEVWISGSTFINNIVSPPEEVSNKRESIAMILKNNSGHVQAKVSLYDNNLQSSGSKACIGNERMFRISQKSYSASKARTPASKCFDSSSKASSVKGKTRYQRSPLPPIPKFTLTDLNMSPKVNTPLKEVTNFNLEVNDSKLTKPNTPINVSSPIEIMENTPNSNQKTKKAKRNSFSGHTPYKLSKKVSRSESSPACQRSIVLRE